MKHELQLFSSTKDVFRKVESGKDPYPVCIEIHPTDFCNQSCNYCFHGGNGFGEKRDVAKYMQPTDYQVFFREMSELGIHNLSISGGGEPFLSRYIVDILDIALENQLKTRIVTNGNFLPPDAIEKIINCEEIRFSIDTPDPEIYARIRHVSPRLHNKTLQNIRALIAAKRNSRKNVNIGATCIIGEVNARQLTEFANLMLGDISLDTIAYKADIYSEFKPNEASREEINNQLAQVKQLYGNRVEIRPILPPFQTGAPCVVPYFKPVINPYGELYSCCLGAQPRETNGVKLGNISEAIFSGEQNPFAKVWTESKQIREKIKKRVSCTTCSFTDREINQQYVIYRKEVN